MYKCGSMYELISHVVAMRDTSQCRLAALHAPNIVAALRLAGNPHVTLALLQGTMACLAVFLLLSLLAVGLAACMPRDKASRGNSLVGPASKRECSATQSS